MNINSGEEKKEKVCLECDELFLPSCENQEFCSDECEDEYDQDNNSWRYSNYEGKNIEDWDDDDHLAAWFDDMLEK